MNKKEEIHKLRERIESYDLSFKDLEENLLDDDCNENSFITDNSWRQRKIGETYHIHIGIRWDWYFNVEESKELIKKLDKVK